MTSSNTASGSQHPVQCHAFSWSPISTCWLITDWLYKKIKFSVYRAEKTEKFLHRNIFGRKINKEFSKSVTMAVTPFVVLSWILKELEIETFKLYTRSLCKKVTKICWILNSRGQAPRGIRSQLTGEGGKLYLSFLASSHLTPSPSQG